MKKRLLHIKGKDKTRARACDMIIEKIESPLHTPSELMEHLEVWLALPEERFPPSAQPPVLKALLKEVGLEEEEQDSSKT